jgi:hypothetical protein
MPRMVERGQGSLVNLADDDPEHVFVIPGGLLAPTTKVGLTRHSPDAWQV